MPEIAADEMTRRRQRNASVLGSQAMIGCPADAETVRLLDRYAEGELDSEELSAALDFHARNLVATLDSRTCEAVTDDNATRVIDPSSEARNLPELFAIVRSVIVEMRASGFRESADKLSDVLSISSVPGEIIGMTGFLVSRLLYEGDGNESITLKLKSALLFARTVHHPPVGS